MFQAIISQTSVRVKLLIFLCLVLPGSMYVHLQYVPCWVWGTGEDGPVPWGGTVHLQYVPCWVWGTGEDGPVPWGGTVHLQYVPC